jgi:hypothetical protein
MSRQFTASPTRTCCSPDLPPAGTDSFTPQNLPLAYIAAGDERNAEATLRRYYPVEQLQPITARSKAQARRLHR